MPTQNNQEEGQAEQIATLQSAFAFQQKLDPNEYNSDRPHQQFDTSSLLKYRSIPKNDITLNLMSHRTNLPKTQQGQRLK